MDDRLRPVFKVALLVERCCTTPEARSRQLQNAMLGREIDLPNTGALCAKGGRSSVLETAMHTMTKLGLLLVLVAALGLAEALPEAQPTQSPSERVAQCSAPSPALAGIGQHC
jgi:hypothetical protein